MKLTDEQINEMLVALKNATQGTWNQEGKEIWWRGDNYVGENPHVYIGDILNPANAHLVANAPTWIRQLIADRQVWKEEAERLQTQLNQAVEVLKKTEKFIDAILSFYGQNLMVFNWHQNGDGEPWDNFFDDNMDGDELEIIQNFLSSLSEGGKPKLKEVTCKKCEGNGYHHGFGEGGHDPDYCSECGGIGRYMKEVNHETVQR